LTLEAESLGLLSRIKQIAQVGQSIPLGIDYAIERIEQSDDKLATTIKELMFTFEDIINLNATAIREILKNVDKKDLMVAFKGSSDGIKDKFLSNMSQRAAEAFKEEMQYLGAVRVKDVEEAQRRIVEVVQTLADQGVFQVGEADEMIE